MTRRRIACTSATKPVPLRRPPTPSARRSSMYSRPSVEVAGDRPRLEQRLELPGLRPALVVADGGWRACAPAGRSLPSGRSAASTGQIVPSPVWSEQTCIRWDASCVAARIAWSSAAPVDRLGHEDHVDVADVVELVAAALAHRDHRQPAARAPRRRPVAGRPPARPPGCRRPGRRARRRRRRRRRRARGRGRRAAAGAGGTPRAARRPQPRRRQGRDRRRRRRGRRRPRSSSAVRSVVRRGPGAARASGRSSSRHCSGCRSRWLAEGAARAEHREQPHRGALVVDEAVARARPGASPLACSSRSARSASGPRPGRGRRCGRAGRAGGSRQPAEPLEGGRCRARSPGSPARTSRPRSDSGPGGRHRRTPASSAANASRQRLPRRAQLAPGVPGPSPGTRRGRCPARRYARPVVVDPRLQHGRARPPGGTARPRRTAPSRAACTAPSGLRARTRAPSGSRSATSLFQCEAADALGQRAEQRVVGGLVAPADRAARRSSCRRGCVRPRRRAPPPRPGGRGRCPRAGTPRRPRRRGPAPGSSGSHGAAASSHESTPPPSTSSPSCSARSAGRRVAGVRAADVELDAGCLQPLTEPGGRRADLVLDDRTARPTHAGAQITGSIWSRSKTET